MSVSRIILAKLWGKKCRYPVLPRLFCENSHFHSVFILCWWDKIVQLFGVKLDNMYTNFKMLIHSGPSDSISKNFILKNNHIHLRNYTEKLISHHSKELDKEQPKYVLFTLLLAAF